MKSDRKYLYWICTCLIFLTFLVTRLWNLMTIPFGLHVDEASMAYSAWSLANFGVDRYLKSWPVYLINFDGGQSVLYCYLCAGLFKLFGYAPLLIRLPALFFSFLTLLFGMLLTGKLYPQKPWIPLTAGALITVCPYFILAGRFGLDCNLMLGMSTVFLYCFTCAIESGQYRWYLLAGGTGGLVLYTYAISYLVLPLFLLLSFLYIIWTKKFSFTRWVSMAVPMGFLAFPLLLEQYINAFDKEEIKLGVFTVTRMATYRAVEIGRPRWIYFHQAMNCIFRGDGFAYNSVSGFRNLYWLTIPLAFTGILYLLFGLGKALKDREFSSRFHPLFWFLAMILVESCLIANVNKINGIFVVVILLAVEGILFWMKVCRRYGKVILILCAIFYGAAFIRFGGYYYLGGYSEDHSSLSYFNVTVSEALDYLEENPQYQNKGLYIDGAPVYLALSMRRPPHEMLLGENQKDFFDYYHCYIPEQIEQDHNYILRDTDGVYAEVLRDLGYQEVKYTGYSLFCREQEEAK